MDQPSKVANPARSRLRIWSPETGLAVLSRVTLLVLHTQAKYGTRGIPPDFRGGVHLFMYTSIRHRISLEFMRSRNCVPMALKFTAESPPAQEVAVLPIIQLRGPIAVDTT